MKQKFDHKLRLHNANKARLKLINEILEEYVADGFVLTLRQLYYQLVSRGIIANRIEEYNRLSNILKKGRMAGIVDWAAIEDRVRTPKRAYYSSDGIPGAIRTITRAYKVDRMKDQPRTIEV